MPHVKRPVRLTATNIATIADPDEAKIEREELAAEVAASPAFTQIIEQLERARCLGFDPADPDIIRRAITAGTEAHAAIDPMRPRPARQGRHAAVVYYMRQGSLIKIGTTTNIGARLEAVGAQEVLAIEVGGLAVERARHRQFVHLCSHREWFLWGDDLAMHIGEVRQRFQAQTGETVEQWLAGRVIPPRPAVVAKPKPAPRRARAPRSRPTPSEPAPVETKALAAARTQARRWVAAAPASTGRSRCRRVAAGVRSMGPDRSRRPSRQNDAWRHAVPARRRARRQASVGRCTPSNGRCAEGRSGYRRVICEANCADWMIFT